MSINNRKELIYTVNAKFDKTENENELLVYEDALDKCGMLEKLD